MLIRGTNGQGKEPHGKTSTWGILTSGQACRTVLESDVSRTVEGMALMLQKPLQARCVQGGWHGGSYSISIWLCLWAAGEIVTC